MNSKKQKVSVVIISKNSEQVITDCLDSARFADEIVVLDSCSDDRTVQICKERGAQVFQQEWLGFGKQKNKSVALAANDWVFVLDSDERITPALADEIKMVLQKPDFPGYYVPRINRWFGREIRHCGLYPDYSIRLFNRTTGVFNEVAVHESVKLQGKAGTLRHPMLHLAYDTVHEFIAKQNNYSSLSNSSNVIKALLNPPWAFFRIYFLQCGFLEGWHGYIIARLYAQYTFWKYIKGGI